MIQQRAARTRRRVLEAGAAEFARRGYAATTLTHIAHAAGVTMGSITFHFASKRELADAVCELGHQATREAVTLGVERAAGPLQAVIDLTHLLVRLLGEDDLVRAASRLGGEGGDRDGWYGTWLPELHAASTRADEDGVLRAEADPATVTALAVGLVAAAETSALQATCAHTGTTDTTQLALAWRTLLHAVASPEAARDLSPTGPGDPGSPPCPENP
ncbi:TetR/AcrR family transcriptional regulator [Streptomyces sp. WZ-12]|uniref:TetR/AcrR family transcriptional regulator n=1 Tax=Streptomyces sp. WZ-12 TaxID=3030210 RepID=UPI0023814A74|nr:TetR/AcrR family transcriptional regulator [Streptomyces sp. WZ-12]